MSSSLGLSMAGSSLRVHLQQLRWCGFCRLSSHVPARAWRRMLHDLYRKLSLTVTTSYIIRMCIYTYQERNDMEKLARVMFLLLCHITSITKQIVFFVEADRIDRLIASLDDPLYNQSGSQRQALLMETARDAGRFARAFTVSGIAANTLWVVFPIMNYTTGQPAEFPFGEIEYSGLVEFTLISLYSYWATNIVGVGDTTVDTFIATVLEQTKVQLKILRINFENLPSYAKMLSKSSATNETFEKVLNRLFLDCLTHYRKISEMTHLLQDIFGSAILVQFGIGGWILCLSAYKMISLNVLSVEFASMTLFTSCMLIELFLYCYYGNEVTVESDRVVESLYAMEWRHTPARFRRSLVVVMERAKRPLRPVAGRVIPLSLDTFVKIIKSSYTFYAVLRQTKK